MKKSKKILGLLLAMVIYIFNIGTVCAEEIEKTDIVYEELSTVPPTIRGGISVYGLSAPSKENVYPNNTQNYVKGTSAGYDLYTNNCFYGVSKITGSIVNESYGKVKITLYRYLGNAGITTFKSVEISGNSKGSFSFQNLNSSYYYFLKFDGTGELDFHGYVGGVTG